jgi:hypothetical protein
MSDIGLFSGPFSTAFVLLILGPPGLPIGALAGALIWRRHRVGLWLLGWLYFSDNL